MLKLCFYVPESHLKKVKNAVFAAGAGKIDTYDQCCWQVKGQGQFRPLAGSNAFIGEQGKLEEVDEYRVEMLLDDALKREILNAFKEAHPYEVPAYDFVKVEQV
jgi:hypothetical protein